MTIRMNRYPPHNTITYSGQFEMIEQVYPSTTYRTRAALAADRIHDTGPIGDGSRVKAIALAGSLNVSHRDSAG